MGWLHPPPYWAAGAMASLHLSVPSSLPIIRPRQELRQQNSLLKATGLTVDPLSPLLLMTFLLPCYITRPMSNLSGERVSISGHLALTQPCGHPRKGRCPLSSPGLSSPGQGWGSRFCLALLLGMRSRSCRWRSARSSCPLGSLSWVRLH